MFMFFVGSFSMKVGMNCHIVIFVSVNRRICQGMIIALQPHLIPSQMGKNTLLNQQLNG